MTPHKFTTENDVYRELTRRIGREADPDVWRYLTARDYVGDVLQMEGEEDVQEAFKGLVANYRDLESLRQRGKQRTPHPRTEKEIPPDERLNTLALLAARRAAQDEIVQSFRRLILRDKLLTAEEMVPWIRNQEGYREFAVPSQRLGNPDIQGPDLHPEVAQQQPEANLSPAVESLPILRYEHAGVEGYASVAKDSELDWLRVVGAILALQYGWPSGRAVRFVLTGIPPVIPKARIVINPAPPFKNLRLIRLELDPTLSPKEVADIYGQYRSWALPRRYRTRYRAMTKKHLRLAEFYDDHTGMGWQEAMGQWNTAFPSWSYSDYRNFSRDCRYALQRILGEESEEEEPEEE